MELARLLELLYSAVDRSDTVRATIHGSRRQSREVELLRARGLYRDLPAIPPEEGVWEVPSGLIETRTRIWAVRPYWLRWESEISADGRGKQTTTGVKDGELFWSRLGDGDVHTNDRPGLSGTMTTDEEWLLDPSGLLGAYRFEVETQTTFLARPGIDVVARRRLGASWHEFGPLAEVLRLVVDEERGILLRMGVVVDGEETSANEVVEVAFNEPISAELFRPLK
jgi:outer membrane lipoprotein-sorting protein